MLELEHRFRVVDVHARLSVTEDVSKRGRAITPETLEIEMHQAGVVRAVVFADPEPGASYLKANNAVARMCVERPFIAFARINGPISPGRVGGNVARFLKRRKDWHTSPGDIEQYAYDDRFHGFKLHPVLDGIPDGEVMEQLADVGLPVLVHGGEQFPPSAAEEFILEAGFPVVLGHFGGHPLNRDLMSDAIELLGSYDDLYLDTSSVRYRAPMERALREHPDRILFGSGAPSAHPNVAVMEILTLDVPEDAMQRVFTKNPSRLVPALSPERE